MKPAIALDAVSYQVHTHFWRKPSLLLHALTLSVAPGEICGFLGPNGAGKTTTIRLLLDLARATSGQARLFGRSTHSAKSRRGVGFLPERAVNPLPLTAYECVRGHALMAGLDGATAKRRSTEVLGRVGLTGFEGRLLRGFSKGMLQRVGLAQALVAEPRLLILDEPLSGLDPGGRHTVRQIISEVGAAGCAVFFSTHILADVELICDRVAILHRGRLRHVGTPAQLVAQAGAQGRLIEVVAQGANAAALQAAAALGAPAEALRGGSHRFIAANYAAADTLARHLQAAGAQLQLLAPLGGAGLEVLFAEETQDAHVR